MGRPPKNPMAGIKATVTTDSIQPVQPKRRKKEAPKVDLEKCGACAKTIEKFVVADGQRFCSDECVKDYLS